MRTAFLLLTLLSTMCCSAAWAQQNFDSYAIFGDAGSRSFLIHGTDIRVAGSPVYTSEIGFGYQLIRLSATSLWLDVSMPTGFPNYLTASVPASGSNNWAAGAIGMRWMVPVYGRLSVYAVSAGGAGEFHALAVTEGFSPSVATYDTWHGLFDFGGGADFRLLRWFSLRAEVRDLVTGNQLGGAAGRQHVLPSFGIAFHI